MSEAAGGSVTRIVLVDDGAIVCDEPRARFMASEHPLVRRFLEAARIPL